MISVVNPHIVGPLPTPLSPTATRPAAAKAIALAWLASAGATNYDIYRGTSPGVLSFLVSVGDVLAYTDTGLTNNTTYYYAILATNPVTSSTLSNEVSAKTFLAYEPFTGANGALPATMESGQVMTTPCAILGGISDTGEIVSNCFGRGAGGHPAFSFDSGVTDFTMSSEVGAVQTGANTRQIYLTGNALDGNNRNLIVFGNSPTAQILAIKVVAGVVTVIGTVNRAMALGERASFAKSGNNWVVAVDGTTVLSPTDAANNTRTGMMLETNNAGALAADLRVHT